MAREGNEQNETNERRGRAAREVPAAAGDVDLWRGLLGEDEPAVESEAREPLEEHEYPPEVRDQAAAIGDGRARGHLLTVVDGLYVDRTRSTEAERETFRTELARLAELGGGNLSRGLLRDLSEKIGEPVDGAEIAWPEPVDAALNELADWRARTELQDRARGLCPDPERATPEQVTALARLVTSLRDRGDMQGELIAEWLRRHPDHHPWGDRAPELPAWRERCEALRDRFAAGHPGVSGCERLARRVSDQMRGPLRAMETGQREVTTERLEALASSLRGTVGEWQAAVEGSALGPVEVGRKVAYTNRESGRRLRVDVDLIEDGGRVWTEVKNMADFGIGSERFDDLQRQLTRLRWAAEDNPLEDGVIPKVRVGFRRDARRSAVAALEEARFEVVVRGTVIDDVPRERGLER